VYLGAYAPRSPGMLVQREDVGDHANGEQRGSARCDGAISFSMPGYDTTKTAIVSYWLQISKPEGVEFGTGWALLKRAENGWRVERDTYQRSMLLSR
jgi:hypothetical protein